MDDASTVALINEDLAAELDLDGPTKPLHIRWTSENESKEQADSKVVSFTISGIRRNSKSYQLRHVRTMKDLSLPSQTIDIEYLCKKYLYLRVDVSKIDLISKTCKPLILIVQDNWPLIVSKRLINGSYNAPVLSETLLGWVLHGNDTERKTQSEFVCQIADKEKDDLDILHDLVKQQWEIDNVYRTSSKITMSKQDLRAQRILDETMKSVGKRFETGLLWKEDDSTFPENKSNAMKRLICTERKMDKNKNFAKSYCEKMEDLEKKQYIRKLRVKKKLNLCQKIKFGICLIL